MNPELEEQVQQLRRIIEAASRTEAEMRRAEAAVDRFHHALNSQDYDYEYHYYHYYDAMKTLANRRSDQQPPPGFIWSNAGPYYYPT